VPGFGKVADHIQARYFDPLEKNGRADKSIEIVDTGQRELVSGTTNIRASFKDPHLAPLLFNQDVCAILYNYYQRQPYYREQPWIVHNALSADMPLDEFSRLEVSAKYHIDFYRQITMMLIVSDLTKNDTHLQYAIGSHNGVRHPWNRYAYSDADVESKYSIFDCVGPKGTLIIMDAGSGFHRGFHVRGTVRKTLQTVVTTGHFFMERENKMTVTDWPGQLSYPDYVRAMADRISV